MVEMVRLIRSAAVALLAMGLGGTALAQDAGRAAPVQVVPQQGAAQPGAPAQPAAAAPVKPAAEAGKATPKPSAKIKDTVAAKLKDPALKKKLDDPALKKKLGEAKAKLEAVGKDPAFKAKVKGLLDKALAPKPKPAEAVTAKAAAPATPVTPSAKPAAPPAATAKQGQ